MFEEIFHLLSQIGLTAAARPLCDLLADLTGESLSFAQLQQEVHNVLRLHGGAPCADAVLSALIELGYVGAACPSITDESRTNASGAAAFRGTRAFQLRGGVVLTEDNAIVVSKSCAGSAVHRTARGWLDIDGGIYFDVGQHGAGTDPER